MLVLIHLLSAATTLLCAVLLFRGYARNGVRLLLFSGLCFVGLTVNNLLLMIDARSADIDLSMWRTLPALAGMLLLVYALVWESQ